MITSISNSKIKNVIQLIKKSKQRKEQGLFVVEGIRMVREAPVSQIRELYVSESFLNKQESNKDNKGNFKENKQENNKEHQFLEDLKKRGVCYETVADDVFAKMSDTVTPQGILCVLSQMKYSERDMLQKIEEDKDGTYLVLEDIQDPGNLGTMLRTGEGAGISGLIMSQKTADIYNPKTIRSTMGSVYRVPFCYTEDLSQMIEDMKAAGVSVFAAHLKGSHFYNEENYKGKTAFLIGNEGNGLSDPIAELATANIKIPMEGQVESLNAAISASILMYEAYRQKRS